MTHIHRVLFLLSFSLLACTLQAQVKFIQPHMKNPEDPSVYIGIPNYFIIQNTQGMKIINITSNEGKVERLTDTSFQFTTKTQSALGIQFSYTCMKGGKLQKSTAYPVKYNTYVVPDIARLRLGTRTSGRIPLIELKNITRLSLDDREFKTKLKYNIICEVSCKPSKSNEKFFFTIRNGDLAGNVDYQELLGKLSKGDKIRFDNIKAVNSNNTARTIESVTFTVD